MTMNHDSFENTPGKFQNYSQSDGDMRPGANGHVAAGDASSIPKSIAIVGMAMRLPGGVNNSRDFWDLLIEKRDGRVRVPDDRYNVDAFYDASGKHGTVRMQHGNFLQENLKQFDTSLFSMTHSETEKLDPQARLLLEVSREAFENAGETQWRGENIGCYVGTFGEDWQDIHLKDSQDGGMYRVTGYGDFLLGNRISYEYDLKGPSATIKTGCSASLIGLHMACQAITNNECYGALVAGTNLIMTPTMSIAMSELGVLSSDARCKTFDAGADGYARGEAINALYIKSLDKAIQDGNPIQAIIRATATNCDGRTAGISHPSSESHEDLMRSVYQRAGLHDFDRLGFVECHGTGTAIGDPLEAQAVANVFGANGVFITSVKPNVGHSEGASGVTGVIKAVLALQNKTIPPNINFNVPNPKIPFGKVNVPTEAIDWPKDRAYRVCVNSFGLGGANAAALIESAPSREIKNYITNGNVLADDTKKLLVFSANHPDSLSKLVENTKAYLRGHPGAVSNLAYTLGARREHHNFRTWCLADGKELLEGPTGVKPQTKQLINFVFTGQGSQWVGMGRELLADYPLALNTVRKLDRALQALPDPPGWTIENELNFHFSGESGKIESLQQSIRLQAPEFSQPLCTAVQILIVGLLHTWGINPDAVVGHSSGEIAAAYAAQAISAESAIIAAYYRGLSSKLQKKKGGMAAIGLGWKSITPFLKESVVIACENSPVSVTLSGDIEPLNETVKKIKEKFPDAFTRILKVDMAYHSHHMREIGFEYENVIRPFIHTKAPQIAYYSSVTGSILRSDENLGSKYWRRNLECPVLFSTAIQALFRDRPNNDHVFLEIGPHSALQGPLRQIFKAVSTQNSRYTSALIRNESASQTLLQCVGQLFVQGVPIEFQAMCPGTTLTDLPPYPWHHEVEYWDESRVSKDWRLRKHCHHDILGSRMAGDSELHPMWRNVLRLEEVPWIRDHRISSDIIFPGAGYIAMAGEAVRQVTGIPDFTVRQMIIASAMVISENSSTEVITTLRSQRVTDTLDSEWFEFSIMSFNGASWTKNCVGQVRAGSDEALNKVNPRSKLQRAVSSAKWYQAMRRTKLFYGPRFQGLGNISTGTTEKAARATIQNYFEPGESIYQLHPSTIDLCFQLISAASSYGQPRNLTQLCVPSSIESVYVARPSSEMELFTDADVSTRGIVTGNAVASVNGKVVLSMKGLKLFPLEGSDECRGPDPHAACRIHWMPDFDLLPVANLIRPGDAEIQRRYYILVERLSLLCCIESNEILKSLASPKQHLLKYREWLNRQVTLAGTRNQILVDDSQEMVLMSSEQRKAEIGLLTEQTLQLPTRTGAIAIRRIFDSCRDIFEGITDPMELLLKDDVIVQLYNMGKRWHVSDFFTTLCHGRPWLRILEIGAGTGGTTSMVLDHLTAHGERMYSKYDFTDISSGFFTKAKERFDEYSNIEYSVLDITKDPVDQGFEPGSYDVIIAANVLHATPKLSQALSNVHRLLRPDGHLLLNELCSTAKWLNYIMGTLHGWWLGEEDGRVWEPYVSPERWSQELQMVGFEEPTVVGDDIEPYQASALIITTPKRPPNQKSRSITLLCDESPQLSVVNQLESDLETAGYCVERRTIHEEPKPSQDIVAVLDLKYPFFEDISETKFHAVVQFLQKIDTNSGLLWCMPSAQIKPQDPRWAQSLGFLRTVRNELGIDMATLELDNCSEAASKAVLGVFRKFQQHIKNDEYDNDYEWVLNEGKVKIGRFHWFSLNDELAQKEISGKVPKRLEIGKQGLLSTLAWFQQKPNYDLIDDQVEIEVRAVGMNFADVLMAQGLVEGSPHQGNGLGCECSGVIMRVGPGVTNVSVRDRVMVFAGSCYSTSLVTRSSLCARIPADLSFREAATMPCVYSTVILSLLHLGRLHRGQTILIHSACGGVGIAAIQVSRMIGAEIFVTVGSEQKVQYLMDTYHIPKDHIFSSRNSSFLSDVLNATKGRGVDVVLNSLSGELLHASWKCVAPYGSMIEIGKRDFIGRGRLDMDKFQANRAFFGVDFIQIIADRPDLTQSILEECVEYYRKGQIKPISPVTLFPAENIQDAFRFMQKGSHIGKIVIDMPENPSSLGAVPRKTELSLKSHVSYLLVGGLGGLGQAVSTWMVEHGARNLVYLSRSAGRSVDDQSFFEELRSMGCSVQVFAGDVSVLEDVVKAIQGARLPVAGIIQMSMVLRDGPLDRMTVSDWQAAILPKVNGTWNLHKATKSMDIDFMVLFSSFSGLVGQRGQANYASANAFLDAFVQYRYANGLRAAVLDIGPIEDVGYVSTNKAVQDQFRATNVYTLQETDLLDSLYLAILSCRSSFTLSTSTDFVSESQFSIGLRMTVPSQAPNNRSIWKRDRRMAVYRNIENLQNVTETSTNDSNLRKFLAEAEADPNILHESSSVKYLAEEVGKTLHDFLAIPVDKVDITQSITSMNLDSLVAIELRNWYRHNIGVDMTVLEILDCPTLAAFGKITAHRLYLKFGGKEEKAHESYLAMKAP